MDSRGISRAEADALAVAWGARVVEFDLGFLIRPVSTGDGQLPGDGTPTVIDRETGELSHWPAVPDEVVLRDVRAHRAARAGVVRTADPAVRLRRALTRSGLAAAVCTISTPAGLVTAHGAKGDQELRHHPLVRAHLRGQPRLTRGAERHAELVAVSDALHEADRRRAAAGRPPLDLPSARAWFSGTPWEVTLLREPGDPATGAGRPPCETCVRALVAFGLLPAAALGWAAATPAVPAAPLPPSVGTAGFAPGVAAVLAGAGWAPLSDRAGRARTAVAGLPSFPAAERALALVPSADCAHRGPGERLWVRRFVISPAAAAHSWATLAEFGRVLGSRLFPIGAEDGDGVLAIDERSRVFALDQAGEWYLGTGLPQALSTLVLGRDAPRVRDDGTW
ncbi:SUKH-3 domain-containing protein [Spirilliplanes yamanashiensis]|uniref:YwqJ-like deaminase n=1 Tax=Spirilliplanes yamanashiensis TaxID=42233 RepID=A0A8J3YDA1_9ACTN|nr:SUKH-3 domain-containing protein [Spirilliplanes yamanashiensis]MDP9816120.1 hypothetical protein [Spirilliplanes yamanashiensis]GIJ05642.1 hypothetical protein Sya03_49940 [Spirilliplanes yamanashiensis]